MTRKSLNNEEFVPAAEFLYDSLVRDLAEIATEYPEFDEAYLAAFDAKISEVQAVSLPRSKNAKLKATTQALYEQARGLRPTLNRLERYLNKAALGADDLRAVREAINRGNIEGLLSALQSFINQLQANAEQLQAQGMPADLPAQLAQSLSEMSTKNREQNSILSERRQLTETNKNLYNQLYEEFITDVADAGKRFYQYRNPAKYDDYVIESIKSRIRAGYSSGDGVGNSETQE